MDGCKATDGQQRRTKTEAASRWRAQRLVIPKSKRSVWTRRLRLSVVVSIFAAIIRLNGAYIQNGNEQPLLPELIKQLKTVYSALSDFSAEFEHTYTGGLLRTSDTEYGVVYVKQPGRWRFDYVKPEEKSFVSDGKTVHSYFPDDHQIIVSPLPTGPGALTPALFLAGEGDLTRDFTSKFIPPTSTTDTTWAVQFTPIRHDANYEFLTLTLDRKNLHILQMATTDFQSGVSTYIFTNLKINQGLTDKFFTFDIPTGFEVLTDDSFTR